MEFWLISFLTLLISFNTSLFLTPLTRRLSLKMKYVDRKNQRTVHSKVVTRLGGAAIYAGIFFPLLILLLIGRLRPEITALLAGSLVIFGMGVADDIKHIPAPMKFIGQLIACFIIIRFGFRVSFFTIPFHEASIELPIPVSYIITIAWILLITNAINFMDGLDGLAAGISVIVSISLFGIGIRTGRTDIAVLFMPIAGSCIGFLRHNFHPAKVFMGDAGSTTIGFTIACLSLFGTIKAPAVFPLLIPLVALGIPAADVCLAVLRRLKNKKSPFSADKKHLHHKLLDLGLTHRNAVITLYGITLLLGLIAYTLSPKPSIATAGFTLLAGGAVIVGLRRIMINQRK